MQTKSINTLFFKNLFYLTQYALSKTLSVTVSLNGHLAQLDLLRTYRHGDQTGAQNISGIKQTEVQLRALAA